MSRLASASLVLTAALALPAAAAAQPALEELLARVAEQQREIDAQRRQIEEQAQRLEAMNAQLQALAQQLAEEAEAPPAAALEDRLAAVEKSLREKPDLPEEMVTAGDFPGSIRIPGRDETFKLGGLVRASFIQSLAPLGSDDRFLTNSIPVGEDQLGAATRFQSSVRPSRLNFEFRTPTGDRPLRAFIEGDFASASGNDFRLRHAYLQFRDFLVGQTWSTFSDLEAAPEELDFEGLNALNLLRQTQVRWTPRVGPLARLAVALEDVDASITGGIGVSQYGDLVVGRRRRYDDGHLYTALSVRNIRGQLEGDPEVIDSVVGWALTVSGTSAARRWHEDDRWLYQLSGGEGAARFLNDLNALGGQDAVFDPASGRLEALPVAGGYLAFEHHWGDWRRYKALRSSVIFGLVYVDNLEIQPEDAYRHTERFTLNLVTSPFPEIDVGAEFVWGRRSNKDGQQGSASQIQFMAQYRF